MIIIEDTNDLTEKKIPTTAKQWIEAFHREIAMFFEGPIGGAWRITNIEERSETIYDAKTPVERLSSTPEYEIKKTLATVDITAIESGPLNKIENGETVPIHRRKMRCRAELESDGTLKIIECDVEAPKRAGY